MQDEKSLTSNYVRWLVTAKGTLSRPALVSDLQTLETNQ